MIPVLPPYRLLDFCRNSGTSSSEGHSDKDFMMVLMPFMATHSGTRFGKLRGDQRNTGMQQPQHEGRGLMNPGEHFRSCSAVAEHRVLQRCRALSSKLRPGQPKATSPSQAQQLGLDQTPQTREDPALRMAGHPVTASDHSSSGKTNRRPHLKSHQSDLCTDGLHFIALLRFTCRASVAGPGHGLEPAKSNKQGAGCAGCL